VGFAALGVLAALAASASPPPDASPPPESAAGAEAASSSTGWHFHLRPAPGFESPSGDLRVRFGGRLLLDGGLLHYGQGLRLEPVTGWTSRGKVRQVRASVAVEYRRLEVFLGVDLSPDDSGPRDYGLTDAYVGLRRLPVLETIRFGHQKEPFSLENLTSRKWLVFMERSIIKSLTPNLRDIGLKTFGTALGERLRWSLAGSRSTEVSGRAFSEPPSYLLTGRVTGLPLWADDGRSLLHVGASYSHQFSPGTLRISQKPESFLADALVDTGTVTSVDGIDRFGAEIAWVRGPLSVQGEAIATLVHRSGSALRFWGAYAMVSWFVTGEHRAYNREMASFGAVRPRRDFAPWRSLRDLGALQLGIRFSHLDLDDREVQGGIEKNLAIAINWFPRSWLRVSGNYIFGHLRNQGSVNILQMRLQFEF